MSFMVMGVNQSVGAGHARTARLWGLHPDPAPIPAPTPDFHPHSHPLGRDPATGLAPKEAVRRVYDGTYFYAVAEARRAARDGLAGGAKAARRGIRVLGMGA